MLGGGVGYLGYAGLPVVGAVEIESPAVLYHGTVVALGIAGAVVLLLGPAVADTTEPWSRLPAWLRTGVQHGVTFVAIIVASARW